MIIICSERISTSYYNAWCHWQKLTRTTRTPAFWGYPSPPDDHPYYWVILDPKSKEDKVKVTNLKNLPIFFFWNLWILKQTSHVTHLLKLLDKMCKYEMDPTNIVEDTGQTRFCPQTDRGTDGQGETSIPHFQLRWSRGIIRTNTHATLCMGACTALPSSTHSHPHSFL